MRLSTLDEQLELARTPLPSKSLLAARIGLIVVATLVCAAAPVRPVPRGVLFAPAQVEWVMEAADSICGVRESRQIRKPAKVRFDHLIAITPEGKKIKRERIDPDSAKGIRLMSKAKSRVREASSMVMKRQGYDSVWKRISSRKGTHIVDVTAYVEIEIDNSQQTSATCAS